MLELFSLLMFAKDINTFMKTLILTLEHHMSVKLATFVVVFMQKKNKGSNSFDHQNAKNSLAPCYGHHPPYSFVP